MNLPKPLAQWVSKRIETSEEKHYEHSLIWGFDANDVDNPDEFAWTLAVCFPEETRGKHSVDWGEVRSTIWLPIHSALKLCKVGWHSWFYFTGSEPYGRCCLCPATVAGKTPKGFQPSKS